MRGLVKLIIVIVVIYVVWTTVRPWAREQLASVSADPSSESGPGSACVSAAASATEAWGSGLGRFVNPPIDREAWSTFRAGVEGQIGSARSACGCADDSCAAARDALSDLSSLVRDLDSAVQSGSPPPGDLVQRQESIDDRINHASDLARD